MQHAIQCGVDVARDYRSHAGRKSMLYIRIRRLCHSQICTSQVIYECPLGPHVEDCRHDPATEVSGNIMQGLTLQYHHRAPYWGH